jgi:hypothetical protein
MMKRIFTKFLAAVVLLTFMTSAMTAFGQTRETLNLTIPLSSNPGGWPTTNSTTLTNYTYTLGGVDYTFALKNVKCNSGYLMLTQPAVLGLPAIEGYKLTTVVASNSSGCSTSTKVGISSSANQANYIEGGAIQIWSTTSSSYTYNLTSTDANTMYYMYVTNKNAQVISLALTYESVGGANVPSITASNVDITYDATSGAIAYEIENSVSGGVLTAATTATWLTPGTVGAESVAFTCEANEGDERLATVVLTYTYNTDQTVTKSVIVTQGANPNMPGTESNPYTVAQAIAAIDAGTGVNGVYATGIVSQIVTAYDNGYGNITFDMVDVVGDNDFLRAYRCGGTEAANVQVGDVVVVSGNLTYFTSQGLYEFAQGCQVVSLEHPVITDPYITADDVEITYDATSGSITYTIE